MSKFVKTCRACGKEYVGTRLELSERYRKCECGVALPDTLTAWVEPVEPNPEQNNETDEQVLPTGTDTTGVANVGGIGGFGSFGAGQPFFLGGASANQGSSSTTQAVAQGVSTGENVEYELVSTVGSLVVPMPRDGNQVGRGIRGCYEVLGDQVAISRHQFRYCYLDDGSLEIRNLSRFGTTVGGHFLGIPEGEEESEPIVVRPPVEIIMGAISFQLKEKQ